MSDKLTEKFRHTLRELEAAGGLRVLRTLTEKNGTVNPENHTLLNLSSNDYLGIGADGRLWQEFLRQELADCGFGGGACSSRLLTGNHPAYASLEAALAEAYGAESALVLASGYHANVGILPAVTSPRDLILADKLCHASLIDGIRLSRADAVRFPHNDTGRLEKILSEKRSRYENVFIVTESLFSMDGDYADLAELVRIKERYDAILYVDEAHAVGAVGPQGLGEAARRSLAGKIEFLVGTFGKAFAAQGAFVVTDRVTRDSLGNALRTLIFGTALPPLSVRWTERVFHAQKTMDRERRTLEALSRRLREGIRAAGWETAGGSHIVPLITGSNESVGRLALRFREEGFFAAPIRTPTVPKGGERIRISLTANLTEGDIDKIIELCERIGR